MFSMHINVSCMCCVVYMNMKPKMIRDFFSNRATGPSIFIKLDKKKKREGTERKRRNIKNGSSSSECLGSCVCRCVYVVDSDTLFVYDFDTGQ